LLAWLWKLSRLFARSKKLVSLDKSIGFAWLFAAFGAVLVGSLLEAQVRGNALYFTLIMLECTGAAGYVALSLFSGWFALLALSLTMRVTAALKFRFCVVHLLVNGVILAASVAAALVTFTVGNDRAQLIASRATGFFAGVQLTYAGGLLAASLGRIAFKFWKRPPTVVRQLRFVWVSVALLSVACLAEATISWYSLLASWVQQPMASNIAASRSFAMLWALSMVLSAFLMFGLISHERASAGGRSTSSSSSSRNIQGAKSSSLSSSSETEALIGAAVTFDDGGDNNDDEDDEPFAHLTRQVSSSFQISDSDSDAY
jgi:hypothetical protein